MGAQEASTLPRHLVVFDAQIPDLDRLRGGLVAGVESIVIEGDRDGVEQISAALAAHPAATLSIVAHGFPGGLQLGAGILALGNLSTYAANLQTWFAGVASPSLNLYACNVAAGDAGEEFLAALQRLTGASVAASAGAIGRGNWYLGNIASPGLRQRRGYPHSPLPLTPTTQRTYPGTLAIITVTSLADNTTADGLVTLREAIQAANTNLSVDGSTAGTSGADEIVFATGLTGKITLGGTQLSVSSGEPLTITGPGASNLTIDGNKKSRVISASDALTLSGLTITGGTSNGFGGGISVYSSGSITLTNSTVSGNSSASGGGGIGSLEGSVTLTNSTVSGNSSSGFGGGIWTFSGSVTLIKSTVSGNFSDSGGGGIRTFSGSVTLTSSTISGNSSASGGGGIAIASSSGTIENSTITANVADADGNDTGDGGGLISGSGTFTIRNSIIWGNTDKSSTTKHPDISGSTINGNNNNIIGNLNGLSSGTLGTGSDIVGSDPFLGPLQDNGGDTFTHALVFGGPAINGSGTGASTTDQRGATKVETRDIGAYEDAEPSTINNLTSSIANGTYKIGEIIPITVTFSEPVNVSGTPQLTLETGATDAVVNYTSGSGTNTLTLNYTIAPGQTIADLDYIATTALSLNGGTIKDIAGNAATLTLAAPGAAGSLGDSKNLAIDGIVPTINNVSSSATDGTYKVGDSIPIKVTFSEPVSVTGTPQLTLETGATDVIVDYASGSGTNTLAFNYTIAPGQAIADLDYISTAALSLNGGTIKDIAGNTATLTLAAPGTAGSLGANKALAIDGIVPTISNVTSSFADGTYKIGDIIPITVTFSEPVNVTGTPQLTLETGATDAVVNYTSGSGSNTLTFNYTIAPGQTIADLDYISAAALSLNGGTIQDIAENTATLTLAAPGAVGSLGANKALAIDGIVPTISNVTSTALDGTYKVGDIIPITITFSEPVNVTGTPQLTLETGTTDAVVNYTGGTGKNTLTFDYTIAPGQTIADLDYLSTTALSLNGGTIKDIAGNTGTLTLAASGAVGSLGANKALMIDGIVPTINNVSSTATDGTYKVGDSIPITVTFSEPVNVSGTPQLTLETGATDAIVNYTSGSGTNTLTFNYTISPGQTIADLDYLSTTALSLNGGTIKDIAGNNATLTLATPGAAGSLGNSKDLAIDGIIPTINSVSSTADDGAYKVGDIIPITIKFSEPVTVTGAPKLTLETGVTDAVVNYTTGTGTNTLTFDYMIAPGQTIADLDYISTSALSLNGGTIQDIAGNAATLTLATLGSAGSLGNSKDLAIDGIIPTINSVSSTADDGAYKVGDIIPITIKFSEPVTVTGAPKLTLETGVTDAVVNYTTGTGTNTLTFDYTIAPGQTIADLDYISTSALSLNGGAIKDIAGNTATLTLATPGAAGSLGNSKNLAIDGIIPTINSVSSTANDGAYKVGDMIPITITFSESVTVMGTPQLTLETGATDAVVNYTSGSGTNTLTFSYTIAPGPTIADLDYISTAALSLNGGTIKDIAGNTATLTLATPGAFGSLGNSKDLAIDGIIPTISNVTSTSNNGTYKVGDIIPITVTFSESVTVTGTPQLTLETGATDAVVDYFGGSGTNTLTFNYTIAPGQTIADLDYISTSALSLNGGTIKDIAGNTATLTLATSGAFGSLGNSKDLAIDGIVPTINNVSSSLANGTYKVGDVIPITVTFSEPVNVTGTPQLTLETGATDAIVNYASGSGTNTLTFNYTIAPGQTIADLDYLSTTALSLNGGTIKDIAGNTATLTLAAPGAVGSLGNSKDLAIDGIVPTINNVNSSTPNGTYKVGDVIPITITFSEPVNVTGTPQLTLETGMTDAVVNYTSGSGTNTLTFNYTIAPGESVTDLDYISATALGLNGGTIQDVAGNNADLTLAVPGTPGSLGANTAIGIDAIAPTLSSITPNLTTIVDSNTGAAKFTLTVGFSEAMKTSINPTITFPTLGENPSNTLSFSTGAWSNATTYVATYNVVDANEVINAIDVQVSGAQDALGNSQTAATQNDLFGISTASSIQFSAANFSTNENAGTINSITLTRSGDTSGAATVQVNLQGTSTAIGSGTDYTSSSFPLTVNFAANDTTKTIALTLIDDSLAESNETIDLSLAGPINALLGAQTTSRLTIADNDSAGLILTPNSGLNLLEGSTGNFLVKLNSQPSGTVQVDFSLTTGG